LHWCCVSGACYPPYGHEDNLGAKKTGARVNIETDIIGKYVERLMEKDAGIDEAFLAKHGF